MSVVKRKNNKAKECAYTAVFVAFTLVAQLAFSFVAGVEIVTLLFFAYAFVFGAKRGAIVGLVFPVVRQLLFGFFPSVLILYLVYYPLVSVVIGLLGRGGKPLKKYPLILVFAVVLTATFTLLDDIITPLYYGLGWEQTRGYFYASLPVMCVQMVSAGVTVAVGFLPLCKAFGIIKGNLS